MPIRRTLTGLAIVLALCLTTQAQAYEVDDLCKMAKDGQWFGLYMYGTKVGWMFQHCQVKDDGLAEMESTMEFTMQAMGNTVQQKVSDRRGYDLKTGNLMRLDYTHGMGYGSQTIIGRVKGDTFALKITIGNQTTSKTLSHPVENFIDMSQSQIALLEGRLKSGWSHTVKSFDPSSQQIVTLTWKLEGVDKKNVQGVAVKEYRFSESIMELGLMSASVYDNIGRMIEMKIGGMLEAKWETEQEAKARGVQKDFLDLTMLTPDKPIKNPTTRKSLTLELDGIVALPDQAKDHRQTWKKSGQAWRVTIKKEALPKKRKDRFDRRKLAKALAAEPDIQSDHPDIKKVAQTIAADETDPAKKILNTILWLHKNISMIYSPDFSNALDTLHSRRGDCGEFAALFVALARAMDIPARPIYGMAYSEGLGNRFGYHAWAEVWIGRWVSVDPIWVQFPVDVTHLALTRGSLQDRMLLGGMIMQIRAIRVK